MINFTKKKSLCIDWWAKTNMSLCKVLYPKFALKIAISVKAYLLEQITNYINNRTVWKPNELLLSECFFVKIRKFGYGYSWICNQALDWKGERAGHISSGYNIIQLLFVYVKLNFTVICLQCVEIMTDLFHFPSIDYII